MKYKTLKTKTVFRTGDKNKQGPLTEIDIPKLTEGFMSKAKKVYFIINEDNPQEIRGKHYHIDTSEILLCAKGKALVEVHSKDSCEIITINRDNAIFIPPMCWHAVKIEKGAILLAISKETENKTATSDKLLNNCCCKQCGKLFSFKKEIEVALNK